MSLSWGICWVVIPQISHWIWTCPIVTPPKTNMTMGRTTVNEDVWILQYYIWWFSIAMLVYWRASIFSGKIYISIAEHTSYFLRKHSIKRHRNKNEEHAPKIDKKHAPTGYPVTLWTWIYVLSSNLVASDIQAIRWITVLRASPQILAAHTPKLPKKPRFENYGVLHRGSLN